MTAAGFVAIVFITAAAGMQCFGGFRAPNSLSLGKDCSRRCCGDLRIDCLCNCGAQSAPPARLPLCNLLLCAWNRGNRARTVRRFTSHAADELSELQEAS